MAKILEATKEKLAELESYKAKRREKILNTPNMEIPADATFQTRAMTATTEEALKPPGQPLKDLTTAMLPRVLMFVLNAEARGEAR